MARQRRLKWLLRVFSAVTLAALLAVALAAVRAIEVSHRAATEAARADLVALEDAHQLQDLLYQKGFVAQYFLTGDARWLDELHRASSGFEEWLARVTRDARTDDAARAASQLVAEYGRYDADRVRAVEVFRNGDRGAATQMLVENTEQAARMRELAGTLIKVRRDEVTAQLTEGERVWRHALWGLSLALIAAVIGSAGAGFLLARQMTRHVDQLDHRLSQAEKMSALGEMATAMAHEVLNPLTGVKTALQLLRRENNAPAVQETVVAVDAEIRRVEGIARRLMSFARPLQPQKQPCELGDVLAQVQKATRAEAEPRGVSLELDGKCALDADPELLLQALVNLTINACQAMPSGGRVRVSAHREADYHVVEVSDSGEGLHPDVEERLFTPFVTTRRDGHGLGLAISQNIALAHGGRLEARSNAPERGTTFALWLPA